jgi:hypothetical protein
MVSLTPAGRDADGKIVMRRSAGVEAPDHHLSINTAFATANAVGTRRSSGRDATL